MHQISCASLQEEHFNIAASAYVWQIFQFLSQFPEFSFLLDQFLIEFDLDQSCRVVYQVEGFPSNHIFF